MILNVWKDVTRNNQTVNSTSRSCMFDKDPSYSFLIYQLKIFVYLYLALLRFYADCFFAVFSSTILFQILNEIKVFIMVRPPRARHCLGELKKEVLRCQYDIILIKQFLSVQFQSRSSIEWKEMTLCNLIKEGQFYDVLHTVNFILISKLLPIFAPTALSGCLLISVSSHWLIHILCGWC